MRSSAASDVYKRQGHILVESEIGKGTLFRVLLPALSESGDKSLLAESNLQAEGCPPIQAHVLLVDDEISVAEFMGDLLTSRGLTVSLKTDSLQALEEIRHHPDTFDLVVTDQTMPRQTGTELAAAIRRLNPELPVILYSGHSEQLPEEKLLEYGIRGFLKKPVDIEQLFSTMREILSD